MRGNHGKIARASMRCACIDIGSNTTRVLVADVADGDLREVVAQRAFTRIGTDLRATGRLSDGKLAEVAEVVAKHRELAEMLGSQRLRAVATAAIRGAANGTQLCGVIHRRCGVRVDVLTGDEEARLAFEGATRTLPATPLGKVAVVDVGGGSSEIAVGTAVRGVEWSASLAIGSGALADAYLRSDPPGAAELHALRGHALGALEGLDIPQPQLAIAVGGSATSLSRLVGPVLSGQAIAVALEELVGAPAAEVAARHDLEPLRVRLLPAGLLILGEVASRLAQPLQIGRGGLREGVCLELARR